MGQPAARVTDVHICTVTGHTGGPILPPGCPSVVIGGMPAARFGDRASCNGAIDAVVQGAPTILIGGLPAARFGDAFAHGGFVSIGDPRTLMGGPAVSGAQARSAAGPTNNFVLYDEMNGRLFIVSYLEFFGDGASTTYAAAAAAQIEKVWGGRHTVRGKQCDVEVQIRASVHQGPGANSPASDPILVSNTVKRSNQTLGGGLGNQRPTDATGKNLISAHEYGHTLGLDDQYIDTPNGSTPDPLKTANPDHNIMCQTWPDTKDGKDPHSYEEHYNEILRVHGY